MGFTIGMPSLKLSNIEGKGGKHSGNFRKVAKEALKERQGQDLDINPAKADQNTYYGYDTAAALIEYSDKHIEELNKWRAENGESAYDKRKLREDTVVMCATIIKPPAEMMAGLTVDEQKRFLNDSLEIFKTFVGENNIKAVAIHFDELVGHMHIFWEPMLDEHNINAKKIHNLKFFGKLNREMPKSLREKGWNMVDDCKMYDKEEEAKKKEELGEEGYREYRKQKRAEKNKDSTQFKYEQEKKRKELEAENERKQTERDNIKREIDALNRAKEEAEAEKEKSEAEKEKAEKAKEQAKTELQEAQKTIDKAAELDAGISEKEEKLHDLAATEKLVDVTFEEMDFSDFEKKKLLESPAEYAKKMVVKVAPAMIQTAKQQLRGEFEQEYAAREQAVSKREQNVKTYIEREATELSNGRVRKANLALNEANEKISALDEENKALKKENSGLKEKVERLTKGLEKVFRAIGRWFKEGVSNFLYNEGITELDEELDDFQEKELKRLEREKKAAKKHSWLDDLEKGAFDYDDHEHNGHDGKGF